MAELINESVSVDFISNHLTKTAYPWMIHWHGRRYHITKVGLHYIEHDGRTLIHVYSVTDGTSYFKLRFDTETLGWKLVEIEQTH